MWPRQQQEASYSPLTFFTRDRSYTCNIGITSVTDTYVKSRGNCTTAATAEAEAAIFCCDQ